MLIIQVFKITYGSIFSQSNCSGIDKNRWLVVNIDDGDVYQDLGRSLKFGAAVDCPDAQIVLGRLGRRQVRIQIRSRCYSDGSCFRLNYKLVSGAALYSVNYFVVWGRQVLVPCFNL